MSSPAVLLETAFVVSRSDAAWRDEAVLHVAFGVPYPRILTAHTSPELVQWVAGRRAQAVAELLRHADRLLIQGCRDAQLERRRSPREARYYAPAIPEEIRAAVLHSRSNVLMHGSPAAVEAALALGECRTMLGALRGAATRHPPTPGSGPDVIWHRRGGWCVLGERPHEREQRIARGGRVWTPQGARGRGRDGLPRPPA